MPVAGVLTFAGVATTLSPGAVPLSQFAVCADAAAARMLYSALVGQSDSPTAPHSSVLPLLFLTVEEKLLVKAADLFPRISAYRLRRSTREGRRAW